jgi:copper oxidase (laccase) domain-containing protein
MNVNHPTDEKRLHIDLKEINRCQLLAFGILAENIEVSPIDTYTDERFFSARREQKGNVKCGRILSGFVIM